MKKMPCLFVREFHSNKSFTLTNAITPGCEWVSAGEGRATRKWDGTACAIILGKLYKRYDAKKHPKTGEYKLPPTDAIPCCEPDAVTGHWPHWILVGNEPEGRWHREAADALPLADGTYELVGPRINGGPESVSGHMLVRHGDHDVECERTFDGLKRALEGNAIEGIVFHHPDGRMCKIRRADYGIPWGVK